MIELEMITLEGSMPISFYPNALKSNMTYVCFSSLLYITWLKPGTWFGVGNACQTKLCYQSSHRKVTIWLLGETINKKYTKYNAMNGFKS